MKTLYNLAWNPHYDFENPAHVVEIEKMARYDACFKTVFQTQGVDTASDVYADAVEFLDKCNDEAGGAYEIGRMFTKDWGTNGVIDVKSEDGEEVVIKEITVFANNMLSLQSHNGRREEWKVTDGVMSLIMDGDLYEVSDAGAYKITNGVREAVSDTALARQEPDGHWTFILAAGSAHCMINRSDAPATVIETQRGICREADNKRYADQCRNKRARAVLPLTSEALYLSAQIYWAIEKVIANKMGWGVSVDLSAL